jgi:hypothetical protein
MKADSRRDNGTNHPGEKVFRKGTLSIPAHHEAKTRGHFECRAKGGHF